MKTPQQTATELVNRLYAQNVPTLASEHMQPQTGHSSTATSRETHWACLVHIWKVFGDAFGYKWLSQNGDSAGDTIKTWARSLWGQSDEDLLEGARNVVDVWPAGDFPPDLPAFRAYVKMAKEQRLSQSKAPLLDCHRAQPAVVTRWMAAMKKIGTPDAVVSFDAALAEVSNDRGW